MLAPDVLSFKSNSKFESNIKAGKVADTSFESSIKDQLKCIGNVTSVKIIIPSKVPSITADEVVGILTDDTDYYVVEHGFDLAAVLNKTFHQNFVSCGDICLCSSSRINSFVPFPHINLANRILNVRVPHGTEKLARFIGKSVVSKDSMIHYQRKLDTLQCSMTKKEVIGGEIIMCWSPFDESICPSSLASYLVDKGMQVRQKSITTKTSSQRSVSIPKIIREDWSDWDEEHLSDVEAWLGGFLLHLPAESLMPPEPNEQA